MTQSSSLTSKTYGLIRLAILNCELKPGSRIKIKELCERFGVSLSAVRESLSRLTSDGLVISEPQKGFMVAPVSLDDLADLIRSRVSIEDLCQRSAIENGDVEWEAAIIAAHHRLHRAPIIGEGDDARPSEEWFKVHVLFHQAIVSACTSRRLLEIRSLLALQADRYMRMAIPFSLCFGNNEVARDHDLLVEAMLGRRADEAGELIKLHLSRTWEPLTTALTRSELFSGERANGSDILAAAE